MFKFKKRSARVIKSMHNYSPSSPSGATSSAKMGIADEHHAYADDSVTANADAGAVNEPLVLDLGAIYDGYDKVQSPPLTPPPSQKASQEQPDRWLSDDEQDSRVAPAPAPPDFTRRGIHIPSRTR